LLTVAVLSIGAVFLMNHNRGEGESHTIREMGQETVIIIDEFLDGTLASEDARVFIDHMLEAIDYHVQSRRDSLSIRETNIRQAMSGLSLDLAFPNPVQIRTNRNRLAELVGMPER